MALFCLIIFNIQIKTQTKAEVAIMPWLKLDPFMYCIVN